MNLKRMLDRLALHLGYTAISLILLMMIFNDFVKIIRFVAAL